MAHLDLVSDTTPVIGIAASHRRTVAAVLNAAWLGLFSAAQADMLIDRVRALVTKPPIASSLSVEDGHPSGHDRHLAILSMGESWHNPPRRPGLCSARRTARPGRHSARMIWTFEKLGWLRDVRWTNPARAGPAHRHHNGANGPFAKQSP